MKTKRNNIDAAAQKADNVGKPDLPGYPDYPAGEDIFSKSKEEKNLNPEDPTKTKALNEIHGSGKNNEKDFGEDVSGDDLDVPGSELDDEQEENGNEDEENNFYSLGGDNHTDLEEDQGG